MLLYYIIYTVFKHLMNLLRLLPSVAISLLSISSPLLSLPFPSLSLSQHISTIDVDGTPSPRRKKDSKIKIPIPTISLLVPLTGNVSGFSDVLPSSVIPLMTPYMDSLFMRRSKSIFKEIYLGNSLVMLHRGRSRSLLYDKGLRNSLGLLSRKTFRSPL